MTTKTATLYAWVRCQGDTRDTASDVRSFEVPQKHAARVARELDEYGVAEFDGQKIECAAGHGVTVKYASGRKREVRA